jgi:hypothetical protein
MKASLYGLLLAGLLVAPLSAEARGGGGGGGGWHRGMTAGGAAGQALATFPFQSTIGVARQAAIISRLRAQQAISNQITASGSFGGFDGFDSGLGGGLGGGFGGTSAARAAGQALATFPFQSTIGVARQAAIISRLRAEQAVSNQIAASGGLSGGFGGFGGGFGGFDDGFAGFDGGLGGFGGGFGGGLGLGVPGSGFAASSSQLRAPIVAHPHIITVTSSQTQPGEIQIIRGTSVENVKIPATH